MCESAFSVSSVPNNLVTTFHVHTPATCPFRTKGRFNPANGVTRELPVSWLAVGWRYALLPLVMRECGIPMVWATIFPKLFEMWDTRIPEGQISNTVEEAWIHASPMCRQFQPRTKGHPKTPCCVDPLYWSSIILDWSGSPNASRGLSQEHDDNPPRATWFIPAVRIANPWIKTWVRNTTLFLFRRGVP